MSSSSPDDPRSGDPLNRQDVCEETSGFLFSHPCGQFARYRCATCQKPICVQHSVPTEETQFCITCSRKNFPDQRFSNHDHFAPYWYSTSYYDDKYLWSGTGTQDFTQSDEAAMSQQGDAEWERNLGAS